MNSKIIHVMKLEFNERLAIHAFAFTPMKNPYRLHSPKGLPLDTARFSSEWIRV